MPLYFDINVGIPALIKPSSVSYDQKSVCNGISNVRVI